MRSTLLAIFFAVGATPHLLAFDFYDAGGKLYRSTNLAEDIQRHHGFYSSPRVVLVQTPSLTHSDYKRQMTILGRIDAERLNLLYVVSSRSGVARHGYHTTPKASAEVTGHSGGFRVTLFNSGQKVLATADHPLSAKELQRALAPGGKTNASSSK